jgi:magnesium and cobalt exporter, CNNM family
VLTFYLGLFSVCLATSFLFSGMEAGVFALSRLRIRQLMRKGNPRARVLYGYLENPENFLWTILVGNTLSNITVGSLGVMTLYAWLLPWPAFLLAALLMGMILFYALFELLPKMLFRLYPNRLCLLLAAPFRTIHLVLKPIISVLTLVSRWVGGRRFTGHLFGSRDELRILMQESAQSLTSEERVMINRVMDLQNIKVDDIAIPLSKTVTATAETPALQALELIRRHGFSRLPVWDEEGPKGRLVGLATVKALLYEREIVPSEPTGPFVRPALRLAHGMRLDEALRQMQRQGHRLAIVIGSDGRETGIISLQDILRAVFGDVSL